jgi:hypothetical protein
VVAPHLRTPNIRLVAYQDDWFVVNQNKQMLMENREKTLNLIINLGFIVNLEKSNLILTQTITYIGALFCLKEGIVRPTSERITKLLLGIENILKKGKSSYIKRLSSSISYYGFLHRTNTECKLVHATNSVTPFFSLETIKSNSGNKKSFFETFKKSSKMVVEPEKSKQGQVHNSMEHIDNSNNRRFQKRVRGSPKQKRDFSRYLVQKRESTSHKCIRNGSSDVINTTFPSKISRQKCSDTLGQFNCSKIHKQTRGHTLSSVVHENLETMAIGIRQSDVAESSTHCRGKEHFSRPSKQVQG